MGDLLNYGGLVDYDFGQGGLSVMPTSSGATSSGAVQAAVTGGLMSSITGTLSDLARWDTARRLTSPQGQNVQLVSRQNPNNADYTTRAAAQIGTIRMGDILPFVVVGFIAWRVLK